MRQFTFLAIVVLALAAVAQAAPSGGGQSDEKKVEVFDAIATVSGGGVGDTPPAGDTVGDTVAFSQILYADEAKTEQIGTDEAFCVRTVAGTGRVCTGIFYLKGGTLTITGRESLEPHGLAITGGTGKYLGASGVIFLRPVDPLTDRMTFRVRLGR